MANEVLPDLSDQVVLITGAGRGLGRSAALHLARCGAVVGVADIDGASAAETASKVKAAGGQADSFTCDVGGQAAFAAMAADFAKRRGRIDAVINNAAFLKYEPLETVTEETVDRMIGAGFKSAIWGSQALVRHMRPEIGASIINMSSPVIVRGYPNTLVYSAIKSAVTSLTRTLAAELGPRKIRVNAVAPGSVPTPGALGINDAAEYERRARTIPLRRLGRESDNDKARGVLAEPRRRVHQRRDSAGRWRHRCFGVSKEQGAVWVKYRVPGGRTCWITSRPSFATTSRADAISAPSSKSRAAARSALETAIGDEGGPGRAAKPLGMDSVFSIFSATKAITNVLVVSRHRARSIDAHDEGLGGHQGILRRHSRAHHGVRSAHARVGPALRVHAEAGHEHRPAASSSSKRSAKTCTRCASRRNASTIRRWRTMRCSARWSAAPTRRGAAIATSRSRICSIR